MLSVRLISRWLLLVLTMTILAPGFAWEVMAADEHHHLAATSESGSDAHAHDVDPGNREHADHHSGDGYLFTHLPMLASASAFGFAIDPGSRYEPIDTTSHTSRTPDRLERPPRHRPA
ncbi:MAG: hypothetical protein HZA62_04805 [Rhodocyclales bacterium]|nr:hypothetical protein [Rhodocyclales bacterium]